MPTVPRLRSRPAWPIVLLVLLPLIAAPAQGQIDRWGVKAGVTSMTTGGDGLVDEGVGHTTGPLVQPTARIIPSAPTDHRGIERDDLSQRARARPRAQSNAVDLSPGLSIGLNFATFGGDEAETIQTLLRRLPDVTETDEGRRTGLLVGAFLVADFDGPVDLRPGMRYIQKGNQTEFSIRTDEGATESGSVTVKAAYIEIPILAQVDLPAAGPVVPHLLAGPTLGFSVNTAADARLGGESQSINVGDDFGGNAISLEFGAGADVAVGAATIVANARFGFGLSEVPGVRFSARNRGVIATVGIIF